MELYFLETRHIAEKLIDLVNKLTEDYERLKREYETFKNEMPLQGIGAATFPDDAWSDNTDDELVMQSEAFKNGGKCFEYIFTLRIIYSSRAVLCGSLLQLAKQVISFEYRSRQKCPKGRSVGNEKLADMIWDGRNYAMHFDEPTQKTKSFLQRLEKEYGGFFPYSDNSNRSLVFELISILGWTSFATFQEDMQSLLCPTNP